MGKHQRPVATVAPFRGALGERRLLVQRRAKPDDDTPYDGYIELPQGKIAAHESLLTAARRELAEETGLEFVATIGTVEKTVLSTPTSQVTHIEPICCSVDTVQNHVSLGLAVLVSGTPHTTSEASAHRWVTVAQAREVLLQEDVFPLNIPLFEVLIARFADLGWREH